MGEIGRTFSVTAKQVTPKQMYTRLIDAGYTSAKVFPDRTWAAVKSGITHHFIVRGDLQKRADDMWIYTSAVAADTALASWDGKGHPPGFKSKTMSAVRKQRKWDDPA